MSIGEMVYTIPSLSDYLRSLWRDEGKPVSKILTVGYIERIDVYVRQIDGGFGVEMIEQVYSPYDRVVTDP